MRKFVLTLAVLMLFGAGPAQAQSFTGGNFDVGERENVRYAGPDNFGAELYYTADGHEPTAEDRATRGPAYIMKENTQPAVINRLPGDATGKWWLVIKPKAINEGEVKSEQTTAGGQELPYRPHLDGYLLEVSRLPAGEYFVEFSVSHMGGEQVIHVLFFLFRSKREVKDEAGFWLTVYDPGRPYYMEEVKASPFLRSFEPANGAESFHAAQDGLPREQRQPMPINFVSTGSGTANHSNLGTVVVRAFEDQHQLRPAKSSFRLVSVDGSYTSPYAETVNGEVTFTVPPGTYHVYGPPGQSKEWQRAVGSTKEIVVPEAETTYFIVERRAQ